MRSPTLVLVAGALLAPAGCASTPVTAPICPASATAPVEAEPVAPALTEAQRQAADVAIILALGEPLGAALIRFTDVEHAAWGRRQAARVTATRAWCGDPR